MKIITDEKKINEVLTRGVEEIIVRESLEKKLKSGKQLRIKFGIDPTGAKIHIGRAATLWKLREFQDLGHQIVLIVGDYTAQIGDPSDKLTKRPFLTPRDIKENMKNYKKQLGKILDLDRAEFHHNGDWLAVLTPRELDDLADLFSVQQMIARRNFKERWEKQEDISIRELHYPLYQGYDSVIVKADVELGGSDQLFNLMAGRKIQEARGQAPQDVMTAKMLMGLDGRKMSTSWGNVINIADEPNDMYGKIMSMHDDLIPDYFLLCARLSVEEVEEIKKQIAAGVNPRDLKMRLAKEIVALYHGKKSADEAEAEFINIFQQKGKPEEIPEIKPSAYDILTVLAESKFAKSKTDARHLVEQGGVKVNDQKIDSIETKVKAGDIVQKGSRFFIKVK